ncbi:MAG: hypothetical protein P4L41_12665 [Flavipsychrobacter sp.]|nr:hypothetical protein [Flavipsychrobacter sp.]
MRGRPLLAGLCALLLFATACKKNTNNDVSPNAIVLQPVTVTGNLVKLEWSRLSNDSLQSYIVARVTDTGNLSNIGSVKYITVDKSVTTYTDTLPVNPYVQYYIMANVLSANYQGANIQSNKQTYVRTDIDFAAMAARDALYDRNNKQLYIYSLTGIISVYDLASKKFVRTLNTNSTIGTCDMALYNGKLELYVPRNDGWVFIYDAATLTQIDQVSIGSNAYSVTCNNNKLFISATLTNYNNTVVVYDRTTRTTLTPNTGVYYSTAPLILIPGTNTEFFCVDNSSEVLRFRFDAQGNYIVQKISAISGNYQLSNPAVVYPDGSKVICGSNGVIVDSNLHTAITLPYGNLYFTNFAIDGVGSTIYAATNALSVQTYNMGSYVLDKTYPTQGNPIKVFYDNGKLITVSLNGAAGTFYSYPSGNFTFVEQL